MADNSQGLTWHRIMHQAVDLQRKGDNLAANMLTLAQKCDSVEEFLAKCEETEAWIKSPSADRMRVTTLPDVWMQAKSDIKRGWELGLNVKGYNSVSKLRKDKAEAASKVKDQRTGEPRMERDATPVTTVEQALEDGSVVDSKAVVPADLVELVGYLRPLSELARASAVKKLTDIAKGYHQSHLDNAGKHRQGQDARQRWRKAANG